MVIVAPFLIFVIRLFCSQIECGFYRPAETQTGTAERAAVNGDTPLISDGDGMDDCQPQPAAAGGAITARVQANKGLKDAGTFFRRDARPVVFNLQAGEFTV